MTHPFHPSLPRWTGWLYGLTFAALVPWTIYLAATLPRHHVSSHWDVVWVGVDICIAALALASLILLEKRSVYFVMTSSALATLLTTDAWFDVLTSRHGTAQIVALFFAIAVELPLAATAIYLSSRYIKSLHIASMQHDQ